MLGYPLSLSCAVHDNPASLKFYHNDTVLVAGVTTDNNLATFQVDAVELDTAGEYRCEVEYSASQDTLGKRFVEFSCSDPHYLLFTRENSNLYYHY